MEIVNFQRIHCLKNMDQTLMKSGALVGNSN